MSLIFQITQYQLKDLFKGMEPIMFTTGDTHLQIWEVTAKAVIKQSQTDNW